MPTRYLSDSDLARLSGYPETIADEDLVTYFRLADEDLRWLQAEHRRAANRLGLALQLCTLQLRSRRSVRRARRGSATARRPARRRA